MRISDWSSDVCSSDLMRPAEGFQDLEDQVLLSLRLARRCVYRKRGESCRKRVAEPVHRRVGKGAPIGGLGTAFLEKIPGEKTACRHENPPACGCRYRTEEHREGNEGGS